MLRMSMLLRLALMTGFAVQAGAAQDVSSEHQIKQKITPKVTAAAAQVQISYNGTAVVICSVECDPDIIEAAREAGALGYVFKARIRKDLVMAVKLVVRGQSFVSPA